MKFGITHTSIYLSMCTHMHYVTYAYMMNCINCVLRAVTNSKPAFVTSCRHVTTELYVPLYVSLYVSVCANRRRPPTPRCRARPTRPTATSWRTWACPFRIGRGPRHAQSASGRRASRANLRGVCVCWVRGVERWRQIQGEGKGGEGERAEESGTGAETWRIGCLVEVSMG